MTKSRPAGHTPDEWEYSGNTEVIGIRRVQTLEPICSVKPANYDHARLIAAAPELLASCENLVAQIKAIVEPEHWETVSIENTGVAKTLETIRKARGE